MDPKRLPISQLVLARPAPRSAGDGILLERSIENDGVLMPLTVMRLGTDVYEVIDGERRLVHMRTLVGRGYTGVEKQILPCYVHPLLQPAERARVRLLCNIHSGLDVEEIRSLSLTAGIPFEQVAKSGEHVAKHVPLECSKITHLLNAVFSRRNGIRSSRVKMDALAIARDFSIGLIAETEAIERLRFQTSDE